MKENKPYERFELEEFLSDEKFQDWVFKGINKEFWTAWILNHPGKAEVIDEATYILKNIALKKNKLPVEHIDVRWSQLKKEIHKQDRHMVVNKPASAKRMLSFNYGMWTKRVAAVTLLLVALITGYRYLNFDTTQYTTHVTTYGEKKEISLPDGSLIRMNANSKISIPDDWEDAGRRLTVEYGEAFFDIRKIPNAANPHFIVHTDGMDVIVLGTSFNINSRHQTTVVALTEGSVRLETDGDLTKSIVPGQVVSYSISEGSLVNAHEPIGFYTSWLHNIITLDNISLGKIALLIEDHFGKKVYIDSEELKKRVLTGSVSDGDINIVIRAIESSLDVNAKTTHNKIIFNETE